MGSHFPRARRPGRFQIALETRPGQDRSIARVDGTISVQWRIWRTLAGRERRCQFVPGGQTLAVTQEGRVGSVARGDPRRESTYKAIYADSNRVMGKAAGHLTYPLWLSRS